MPKPISEDADDLMAVIKARAHSYVNDNIVNPTPKDYVYAENAFMLGCLVGEQRALDASK